MKKRLFLYTTLIILGGLLCFFGATVYSAYINNIKIAEDSVIETARICAGLYEEGADIEAFVNVGGTTRITIITSDGVVLADSSSIAIDTSATHLDRPEIKAAAAENPKAYTRYSDSLGVSLIYYALKVETTAGDYVFIRTAIPIAMIDAYLSQSLPLLILILVVVAVLCFILSGAMIARITQPLETIKEKLAFLSEGQYSKTPLTGDYEEIDAIVSEIDDVAQVLQENIRALSDEKTKDEYILNNISDGIFAVNAVRDITLINNAAQSIFDVNSEIIGKSISYLTFDKTLLEAINDCIDSSKFSLTEMTQGGRIYILTVKRIEGTDLTMVVLSDITDSRENAKRREEFFENASHELKTPLTAIRGFNELCAINNKDESLSKYIDGISRETDRMLSLIGDMLRLSELTSAREVSPVTVALGDVAREVLSSLSAAVGENMVEVEITGESSVEAEPEHAYELLKNLMENALRYNTYGGSVHVIMSPWFLKVTDTGIGIPYEAQTRLFERFYRVEKSRSLQSGGTGLGLSIVKHICALYGWELSLKSRPGAGTDVTVVFSANQSPL